MPPHFNSAINKMKWMTPSIKGCQNRYEILDVECQISAFRGPRVPIPDKF